MKKLRIGVIGVAGRGLIADYWKNSNRACVVAGADISEFHLDGFRRRMGGGVFTTLDFRELLDREDVDAVIVSSPDGCHEMHATAALQAGKHVYLEKPMAISIAGCDHVLREWRKSGKKLMIGFNMRHMKMFQTMKQIVDSGAIGDVRAVWVRHFVGMGSVFYYHDWHANSRNSNSLLLQKGSHDIDVIHWISGHYTRRVAAFGSLDYFGGDRPNDLLCKDCPKKATCIDYASDEQMDGRVAQCVYRREVNVEDNYVMIMDLEGGVKATYTECHFTPDGHRNYVFIGTKGQMENSELEGKIWVKKREYGTLKQTYSDIVYNIRDSSAEGHGGADRLICEEFLDHVLLDKEAASTPLDGRMSVAAGCAATKSLRSDGMPFDVPPVDWVGEIVLPPPVEDVLAPLAEA